MHFGRTSPEGISLGDNRILGWQRKLRKIFFVVIGLLVVWIFVQVGKYRIAGNNDSMKGTFEPGSSVIYDRLFDWHDGIVPFFGIENRSILHDNIIVFVKENLEILNPETKEKTTGDYYGISRVVGLPGDIVAFEPGLVIIARHMNGQVIEKKWPAQHGRGFTEPERVPSDRFFVLNDNLASEIQDSRYFGYVRGEEIVGKVLVVLKLW